MGFRKWWYGFAFLGLSSLAFAGDIVVNTFGGLNTQDPPAALQPFQAQDLLNVNIQPGMKSVFKRDGYGLFQSLPSFSTAAVHGGYHFQQTGGGDVQLWGSDVNLYASVNDAAFVKVSTGTDGATWQCTDNLGFAYCLTSANDTPIKTDGTLGNTTFLGSASALVPAGSIITSTPLQLVVAGVSGSLSTINISANNNFTNFTVGPLATDPYTEIINAPGSRITHLAYYFGKIFWWKDQSFGYLSNTGSQYTVGVTIVSNQIGTLDNSSAFWNATTYETANSFSTQAQPSSSDSLGGIFFRGQDNHVYQYDGYTLTRLSRIIAPTVALSGRRKANLYIQATQGDFQSGSSSGTLSLSTNISPGDVVASSFTKTENSSASGWGSGTTNGTTVGTSSITLTLNNSGNVTNNSFESALAGNWTLNHSFTNSWVRSTASSLPCGSITAQDGSAWLQAGIGGTPSYTSDFQAIDMTGATLQTTSIPQVSCTTTWTQSSLSPTSANAGKRVQFRIHINDSFNGDSYFTTSDSYIWGGPISFYYISVTVTPALYIDNVTAGSSTITTGSFTSQAINTGMAYSFISASATWSVNTSTPSFVLQKSANGSTGWSDVSTSTGVNSQVNVAYIRYLSTFTISPTDNALSSFQGFSVIARSSGTYFSPVVNAPNLTTWGAFTANVSNGDGSHNFYLRSSATPFYVQNSSPPWVAQTVGGLVSATPAAYFQVIDSFTVTSATGTTPALNDFTVNWFEGTAGDKAYISYFQDAIWFSVSNGTSTSTNNQIFYLDLLNNAWLKYDVPANGFAVENNALYFGDPTQARIFKYGTGSTDNGAAINAYWKSKDFTGDDPTVQNEFKQADFIFNEVLSTATYTYNIDQAKTSTVVLIPLYNSAMSIVKRGFLLANGKIGTFYNFRVGDNSTNSKWTLLMHRVHYNALNWTPQNN